MPRGESGASPFGSSADGSSEVGLGLGLLSGGDTRCSRLPMTLCVPRILFSVFLGGAPHRVRNFGRADLQGNRAELREARKSGSLIPSSTGL